jgi:hypothetical protein
MHADIVTDKFPFCNVELRDYTFIKGLNVAKTLLGVSIVCVIVPLTVNVFPLPELSVPKAAEFSNFKKNPFVPYVTDGAV